MEHAHEPDAAAPVPAPAAPETAAPAPTSRSQLIRLQQAAGNQAVVAMLRRTVTSPAADAEAPSATPTPAPAVERTDDDVAAIADPGGYLRSAGGRWDEMRKRYKAGKLGFKAGGDDKGRLAADGKGMNAPLAHRLRATVLKKKDGGDGTSPSR